MNTRNIVRNVAKALPGTSKCPYCEGKADLFKNLWLCVEVCGKAFAYFSAYVLIAAVNLITPMIQRRFIDDALATGTGNWTDLWMFVGLSFFLLVFRILL